MWYVYILECSGGRFYTGVTLDVERRFEEHQKNKGGHFTRAFTANKIIYQEEYPNRSEALKREFQIKGLTRKNKLALIAKGNVDA